MYNIVTTDLEDEQILEAHLSGNFESEIMFKFVDCLGEYESRYPGNNMIVDITKMTRGPRDIDQIKSVVQYVKKNGKRQGRMAFVTGDETMRNVLMKLIVGMIDVFKPNKFAACKSSEEAKSWLCAGDT